MQTVTDMLHIECADGQGMPYLGYIIVTLTPRGTQLESLSDCLFLIVPTSTFSTRTSSYTTRFLDVTRDEFGSRFLQNADLHTSWYRAFKCMTLRKGNQGGMVTDLVLLSQLQLTALLFLPW